MQTENSIESNNIHLFGREVEKTPGKNSTLLAERLSQESYNARPPRHGGRLLRWLVRLTTSCWWPLMIFFSLRSLLFLLLKFLLPSASTEQAFPFIIGISDETISLSLSF